MVRPIGDSSAAIAVPSIAIPWPMPTMTAAAALNTVPSPVAAAPNATIAAPPAAIAMPTLKTVTIKSWLFLIQSLVATTIRTVESIMAERTGSKADPIVKTAFLRTFHNTSIRSPKASAAWASSVAMVSPRSRACCCNSSIPCAPLDNIGSNCVPDLPKIAIAVAVFSVGSVICDIRSAIALNCSSGESLESCATLSPSDARVSWAACEPDAASKSIFCIFLRDPSSVPRSAPDCSAANPSSDKASTETPVRWLMSTISLPMSAKTLAAPANGVTIPAPSMAILVPIPWRPLPNASSRLAASLSPFTRRESLV